MGFSNSRGQSKHVDGIDILAGSERGALRRLRPRSIDAGMDSEVQGDNHYQASLIVIRDRALVLTFD